MNGHTGLSVLEVAILVAGLVGYFAVLTALFVRGRWRRFPALTLYASYLCASDVFQLLTQQPRADLNNTAYWLDLAIDFLLQLSLLVELARLVFPASGRGWTKAMRKFLLTGSLIAFCISLALAMKITVPPAETMRDLWDMRADVFTSLLICSLILLYSIARDRFGLPREYDVTAIGRGFSMWAATALLGDVSHMNMVWRSTAWTFDTVSAVAWDVMLTYWAYVLWKPQRISDHPFVIP